MSDLANWVVAGGTLALALATGWLGWQTKRAVDAASREASSTADLVAETRRDRELEFRPYVVWEIGNYTTTSQGVHAMGQSLTRNVGRGPALKILLAVYWPAPGRWFVSSFGDVAPSSREELGMNDDPGPNPVEDLVGPSAAGRPQPFRVAFCQDQLGNTYRFLAGTPDVAVWARETQVTPPEWVSWYRSRLPS